jgi:hypothetical protein
MRKRLNVGFAIFVMGAMTTPLQAADDPNIVILKVESHSYVIPRDLIWMTMNREHGPVLLGVQWPEFTAPTIRDPQEKTKRTINVSFPMGPVMTVARHIERLNELHYSPEIGDAPYGLRELRSGLAKEFREYIASPEGGAEYVMHCDSHSCGYYFEYLDLPVNVYFNATLLSNWRKIHQKTLSLLNGMRKD